MPPVVYRNLSAAELTQHALKYEPDSVLSARGALVVLSYAKTGRSPSDKRIVKTPDVSQDVDWGKVNIPLTDESFVRCKQRALDFLNSSCPRQYVVDCFAGHDPRYQLKIRVIASRPYHALFIRNMLIVPKPEQLAHFVPDYVIYNAGECNADVTVPGVASETCVSINFQRKEVVILGTQYAGEMKKGVLTIMFQLMPAAGHLCMHASANVGKANDVTVFFGLSGTGKTTLSADPQRPLIGDDEHVWTDKGVFNVEGGCYAKAIGLNPESEREIWSAVRFGAVAENCVVRGPDREIDFDDESICKNTRVAYPLHHIDNALKVAVAGHPRNIVFLTNDAFGVMPPVARLNEGQAMFWFITGYTANVAGVVAGGTNEPTPTFSSCFGAPFLVRHPTFYGKQLAQKMVEHKATVWLVNTGYTGGAYGKGGKRMKLSVTRAILDQIHNGTLGSVPFVEFPGWGIQIPTTAKHPAIPDPLLNPVNMWADKAAFYAQLNKLALMFQKNFEARFADKADAATRAAVPKVVSPPSKI